MQEKFDFIELLAGALIVGIVLLVGLYFVPWKDINWGSLQFLPGKTITVVGEAETKEKSQIAEFTAGVSVVADNKDGAVAEVNQKLTAIVEMVKNFGVKAEDIKTQNVSIYQAEETYYEDGREKRRPGQWRVSNSVSITLRDADKAGDLADLLAKSGATETYGPSFSLDNTAAAENSLLEEAIAAAAGKAEIIARATGGRLGKIVSVTEGYQTSNIFRGAEGMGIGGGGVEPGTGKVRKVVTVVFELK